MELDTRFRIASMTKPITAVAAMILVEEGRLGLDDGAQSHVAPQSLASLSAPTVRVLMVACITGDKGNFGFGDIMRVDAAHTLAAGVHFEHDLRGLGAIETEKSLEYIHHEFHGRVVVVDQHDLIQGGLFDLGRGLGHGGVEIGSLRFAGHEPFIGAPTPQLKPATRTIAD
jgi:hypothetical protein